MSATANVDTSETCSGHAGTVGTPDRLDLPFFSYGLLKPGELGFDQIRDEVTSYKASQVAGHLHVVNGLPVLDSNMHNRIDGVVLEISPHGYASIGSFEPNAYYSWTTMYASLDGSSVEVNVLVANDASGGIRLRRDGGQIVSSWSASADPIFQFGLPAAGELVMRSTSAPFGPQPLDAEAWRRFFTAQGGYLLLCTIAERLATLRFGTGGPTELIRRLGKDEHFKDAIRRAGMSERRAIGASDGRHATSKPRMSGRGFLEAAYQVRSNIVHRGKSSFREAELVRGYCLDLHDALRVYLLDRLPSLAATWTCVEGDRSSTQWRLKPQLAAGSGTP